MKFANLANTIIQPLADIIVRSISVVVIIITSRRRNVPFMIG